MIVQTKTGVLVAGTIGKDPELKHVGQYDRAVLKMTVRYGSEQGEDGKRRGKYLDVDVWNDAEELDGMLVKDDPVIVTAGEIKSREYNGQDLLLGQRRRGFPGRRGGIPLDAADREHDSACCCSYSRRLYAGRCPATRAVCSLSRPATGRTRVLSGRAAERLQPGGPGRGSACRPRASYRGE